VVRLEGLLRQDWDAQAIDLGPEFVDVFVEELEVLVLLEELEHPLEAELVIEASPGQTFIFL